MPSRGKPEQESDANRGRRAARSGVSGGFSLLHRRINAWTALIFGASALFALHMGGAGFTPAFSAALGAKLVRRGPALLLFTACVAIGSFVVGRSVAKTLGEGFVPASTLDARTALVVIVAATAALFVANAVRLPQSTAWVTSFALIALGVARHNLNWHTLVYRLLPSWVTVPPLAFVLTYLIARRLYPLRGWNYRLYEHLTKHEWKLRATVIASSCYLAVGVGAHVANVVGPLATAGVVTMRGGMLLFAPMFGLGGVLFARSTKTVGTELVPLGLYSAAIINVVVGSLVLFVSALGIPQSLVHAQVFAVLAIALAKEGSYELYRHRIVRQIFVFWLVSPLLAAGFVVLQLLMLGTL